MSDGTLDGAQRLTSESISALDPSGMLRDVLDQPAQLDDALWRVESAQIEAHRSPGGLLVCGMGGSAIGADLAAAAIGDRAQAPVRTVRGYSVDPWVGSETTVLCSSYSGNTEETLAAFETAGEAGARRLVLTTGGALAERARAAGLPVIGAPSGLQPRAAVAYMTVGVLECAALAGAAPALRGEIEAASRLLQELAGAWGPDAPPDSDAKALAARLQGTVPVIWGAGPTAAPAFRWKAQVNENAKLPAFLATLPEADHNEICAWDRSGALAPLSAVFLDSPGVPERLRRRIDLTADVVAAGAAAVARVEARGDTAVEQVLSLVLLGDLTSVYLALLDGVDPTPVEPIERFKGALA